MLAAPEGYAGYPAWVSNALGGLGPCIDPTVQVAGKTIATTLLELLTDPALLARARAEFEARTGGGKFVAPLLPADFAPPIDYHWPEYATTERGYAWGIPACAELDG
jgi:aminobenzoyl-glutamate utilization protein B